MSETVASNGKVFSHDRYGLVPLHMGWAGWGDQRFVVGGIVDDGMHKWRVRRVEAVLNYAGGELIE